ncbi:hypothetical protein ZWY2020_040921 [Hordeum vulgare]|nr:hypothetical protein ZWY2020_040921 [Hordeum vulgare]
MNPLTFIRVLGREPWNVARCSSLGCSGDRSYWSLSTANVLLRFSSERCLECLVSSCRGAENPTLYKFQDVRKKRRGRVSSISLSNTIIYVEPSVRPDDSRYGDNPNRLQRHTQFKIQYREAPCLPQACCKNILVRLWALQGILKESHSLFAMFHGPIRTLLDRQPSAEFARGHLHTSQC